TSHHPVAPPDPKLAIIAAAQGRLGVIDNILLTCKRDGEPTGKGTAQVTFNNDGSVAKVTIDKPPYAGTPTASCIASRYKKAKVGAFDGDPLTVEHPFDIPK